MGCGSSASGGSQQELSGLEAKLLVASGKGIKGKNVSPCANPHCHFQRTWHESHCCTACQKYGGHNEKCDRTKNPAKADAIQSKVLTANAASKDPYAFLKRKQGKQTGGGGKKGFNSMASFGLGASRTRKLQIVCMHGMTTPECGLEAMLKEMLGSLEFAKCYYPAAPHPFDESHPFCKDSKFEPHKNSRTWTRDGDGTKNRSDFAKYLTDYINKTVQGPVDVMLGFGQGGYALHTYLCGGDAADKVQQVRGVVNLMAGGEAKVSALKKLRSMHVVGEEDLYEDPQGGERCACQYEDPIILRVQCNHFNFVPAAAKPVQQFLKGMHEFGSSYPTLGSMATE